MKVERSFVSNEAEGKINWAANSAAAYAVVNKDEPNEFGEYPGFRIYPSLGSSIHNTVVNSSAIGGDSLQWATHQLFALQRKDSEPVAMHPSPSWNSDEPRILFNDFFDDESKSDRKKSSKKKRKHKKDKKSDSSCSSSSDSSSWSDSTSNEGKDNPPDAEFAAKLERNRDEGSGLLSHQLPSRTFQR